MAAYLIQASYSSEAIGALIKNPQDRTAVVRKACENLGGKLVGLWLAFGDYDIAGIIDLPDNTSAVAASMAIAAAGTCKSIKTTPLVTFAEGVEAMKKAGTSTYKGVSAK